MEHSKEIFTDIVEKINELKISQANKDYLIDAICELLMVNEQDVKIQMYKNENMKLDQRLKHIEEILKEDIQNIDCDVEIKCPYCNKTVEVYMNKPKMDTKCPECNKLIELEWDINKRK